MHTHAATDINPNFDTLLSLRHYAPIYLPMVRKNDLSLLGLKLFFVRFPLLVLFLLGIRTFLSRKVVDDPSEASAAKLSFVNSFKNASKSLGKIPKSSRRDGSSSIDPNTHVSVDWTELEFSNVIEFGKPARQSSPYTPSPFLHLDA